MDVSIKNLLLDDKVAGLRQVIRGINAGQIRCVLLADDAEDHIKVQLTGLCNQSSIPVLRCESKAELGKELKLERPCATVGFIKKEE